MAFQIDPSIPLQAGKVQFDPASILMQAQLNNAKLEEHKFAMQKLREDYDAQKEARKQQKAMQMGIASDLAAIQSGTPAQYAPMTYQQTPQRGQMPMGMTGVLASERGQNMPQPKLFGEDLMSGNYQLGGGEVTQEAVAGRQPTYPEMLAIGLKQAMLNRDYDNALKFQKAIQESEKTTNEYYGGLTEGIDPKTGQPVLLAMTKTGAVPSGYAPKPKEAQAPKARVTWNVGKGRTEETWGYDAKGNEVLLGVKSLDAPQAPVVAKADPVTQALAIAQGKEDIKLAAEQRAKVAEKYANASEIIPTLEKYITALGKTPETGLGDLWEKGVSFTGIDKIAPFLGNKEQQAAMGEVKNLENILINYAQKQPGPSTDRDVQNYFEQVGAFRTATNLTQKLAAAKSALGYMRSIEKKYGSYASDILSGKVTLDELKARQESVNNGSQAPDLSRLPTANIEKGSVAKDPKTGKPIAMFNGSKWITWGGK